jgi:hypothetical protein
MTRPVLNFTLAVLRSAELGFLGLVMPTLRQTPFKLGARTSWRAGETGLRARWAVRQPCFGGRERLDGMGMGMWTWIWMDDGGGRGAMGIESCEVNEVEGNGRTLMT